MDDGLEYIEDPDEAAFFQHRSRGIYIKTFLTTLVLIVVSRAYHIVFR